MIGKAWTIIPKTDSTVYLGTSTFFIYLLLWSDGMNLKIAALLVFLCGIFIFMKVRKLEFTLPILYFFSFLIQVGKSYQFILMSVLDYPYLKRKYPLGYIPADKAISFTEIITVFLIIHLIILILRKKVTLKPSLFDAFFTVFVIYRLLVNLFVSELPLLSMFYDKFFFESYAIYVYIRLVVRDTSKLLYLTIPIFVSGVLFEAFAALQQFVAGAPFGKWLEALHGIDRFGTATDEYYFVYRPIGTFSYTNNLALYMVSYAPVLIYALRKNYHRLYWYGLAGILISAVITLSRTAWIGLYCVLFYTTWKMRTTWKVSVKSMFHWRMIFIVPFILVLAFYAMPRIIKSSDLTTGGGLSLRTMQITEASTFVATHPFGVGGNMTLKSLMAFQKTKGIFIRNPSAVLNGYLRMAIEYGILGLFLMLAVLFVLTVSLRSMSVPYTHVIMSVVLISMIGAIFQNYFNDTLIFPLIAIGQGGILAANRDET